LFLELFVTSQKEVQKDMREAILHQFWSPIWVKKQHFKTQFSEPITILDFGELNALQGPDFIGAQVLIDGVKHNGSIELHVNSSHWNEHHHQHDERYNQVVLHVVWNHDQEICNQIGKYLPTLCLSDYFSEKDLQKMQINSVAKQDFVCRTDFVNVLHRDVQDQLATASLDEWVLQSEETFSWAEKFNFDWERTLFVRLMAYSVDPQNRMNVIRLANQIPLKVIRRYNFMDYAGWILIDSGIWAASPTKQQEETRFLINQRKTNVFPPLEKISSWQHRNIRPGGYPIQRVLSSLFWMENNKGYLDSLLNEQPYEQLDAKLQWNKTDSINEIFKTRKSQVKSESQPKEPIQHLIKHNSNIIDRVKNWNYLQRAKLIQNAILPIWGARRLFLGKELTAELLDILNQGSFELNRVSAPMKWMLPVSNFNQKNSYELQSQFKHYCKEKRCSTCLIGQSLWQTNRFN
jgi:hypothetical protein